MVVTILAILCILLLGLITAAGYRAVIRGSGGPRVAEESEKCAICRLPSGKTEMVERQIGDYKLLYFCRTCIVRLAEEIGIKV
ncbi:MAG TPA: hypothetical protein VI932_04400 [Bacteroidota bacterium]|nr:hypothetical protein [Bacteroidota bacterium]